ncbi:TetR/AcrR family transcriptional regulator [Mucilaginibacter sp. OK283]|jgi:AcrR family transcriptional regulator|uniref:TetR/AcrR family transcriptional regulator n=1 Tax=Mucilaginibacter sp. OK283 TaxID=1881049 RepID=UPI0008C7381E|nr:TetR/AcrR family transcriptional regulator [Mucilaginibacter sp. OK283]SEP40392.1 transcriptional regulator, TetR family [Mucilaginibacter sp. OK283]
MADIEKYIVENATSLFAAYGPQAVTMDDIASVCGISKKTLYRFFENKEMLIVCILKNLFDTSILSWRPDEGAKPDALHELDRFLNVIQNMLTILTPAFFHGIRKQAPMGYHLLAEFGVFTLSPFLVGIVKNGQSEGVFKIEIEAGAATTLYCQLLKNIMENAPDFFNDKPLSIQSANLFFRQGLLNHKTKDSFA